MKNYLFSFICLIICTINLNAQIEILETTSTNVSCFEGNDGSVTVSVTGGVKPYYYSLQKSGTIISSHVTSDTIHTFNNVGVSINENSTTYLILVEDNLSIGVVANVKITQPKAIAITSESFSPISCTGFMDGEINITATGESGSYIFTLNPGGISNTTGAFSGLMPGNYNVTVTDAGSCMSSALSSSFLISNPLPLAVSIIDYSDLTCKDAGNGGINALASGGTGAYTFSLNPTSGPSNSNGVFTGLDAGVYSVEVTDVNGCPNASSPPQLISEPDELIIDSENFTDITCFAKNDGSINVTASGGTAPYTFTIQPGGISNFTGEFKNLQPGTYTIRLSDAQSCGPVLSNPITISEPTQILIQNLSFENLRCNNSNDGSISVTANGGTAPLTYSINPLGIANSTGSFGALSPNVYTVDITDLNGCGPVISTPVTIENPPAIGIIGENITNISCSGFADGSIEVQAEGGTGTLTYTLTPGGVTNTTGVFNNLDLGIYNVSVTDENSCTPAQSNPLLITSPDPIIIGSGNSTDITCFGRSDGKITITASGGTIPLQYSIPGSGSNSDGMFDNLGSGTYTVSVSDASGCPAVISAPYTIKEPEAITVLSGNSVEITCNGADNGQINIVGTGGTAPLSYRLDPLGINNITGKFINLSEGLYSVTIEDSHSCPPVTTTPILLTNPPEISIVSTNHTDISCFGAGDGSLTVTANGGTGTLSFTLLPGGITNTTGVFTNLGPATYSVSASDVNSCAPATTAPITISEPAGITLALDPSSKIALNCNGDNNGSIKILPEGGTAPFIYSWTGPNGFISSQKEITGLRAGTYSLDIIDARNCSASFMGFAEITEPSEVQLVLSKTDVVCNGNANGTINATASGGTPPYTYSRNGINYFPSNIFSGLVQNTYRIYVKDSKNCIKSDTISVFEPEEFTVASEIRIDNNKCFGDSLGEIRILTVTGGLMPYEYSIDGGINFQLTPSFSFLPAGNYQTVVRDAAGCEAMGNNNLINQPPRLRITNYAQVDVSDCFGNDNGQIAIEATGGTGAKKYSLDGGIPAAMGMFNSVGGGTHLISISDLNLCSFDTTVILSEPDEIIFTTINITDVTGCTGNSNGEISFAVSGGAGGYLYGIDGTPLQASAIFTNLKAGLRTITVVDANNCQKDTVVALNEPAPIIITSENITNASCAGYTDGKISLTIDGGTLPYTFTLTPDGLSNNTGEFTGLVPGIYTVEVNDNDGCGPVISNSLEITEPSAMLIDSLQVSEITCSGNENAEIHIYASGGTGPYDFSIDDELTWYRFSNFTGLPQGTYHLSIKDINNCKMRIDTVSFTDPDPITVLNESFSDITGCFNDATGSIQYELQGGVGNIEYSIDQGIGYQSTGTFNDLKAGNYTITARDERGCIKTSSEYTLDEPLQITASITSTPEMDTDNKGSIIISNAFGGTGILQFSIEGPGGTFGTDTVFTGLDAGFYEVVVRDENSCTYSRAVEVIKILPLEVTTIIGRISCFGMNDGSVTITVENALGSTEFSLDNGMTWDASGTYSQLPPGDYNISVRDSAGRIFSDLINISEPEEIKIFSVVTPTSCNKFSNDGSIDITVSGAQGTVSYAWSNGSTNEDISGLGMGSYDLSVIDENACSAYESFAVTAFTVIEANAGADTSICSGTVFRLNGTGGTDMRWEPAEGLSNPLVNNPEVRITEDTEYVLRVEDIGNCYDIDTIRITVFPFMGLSAGNDTSVFENQEIEIVTTGGPYVDYSWLPTNGIDNPSSGTVIITPARTTIYIVQATDENGCVNRDTVLISIVENLKIYNSFSPNDDGINDFWDIDNATSYPGITVEVFTRWGERIFSSVGYSDDKRWDGRYKGTDVPIGTYYYVVIPYIGGNAITGTLTIVR